MRQAFFHFRYTIDLNRNTDGCDLHPSGRLPMRITE